MGRSFFLGTDVELYAASEAFSAKINLTPTAFGLDAGRAAAYASLNTSYAAAYLAAVDPEQRTKGKVAAKNDAKAALKTMASDLAKIIDGTATVTSEQKIDLGLSVRAARSPLPPPGEPGNFVVKLCADGSVELSWKCANPQGSRGTIYQVWRRVGAPAGGAFEYLGGSGVKKFLDSTIPAGSASVTYQVQAIRSTTARPSAQFNVNVGVSGVGAGAVGATISEATPAKIAA